MAINRARLAFYNIDPIFYTGGTIPVSRTELSKPYVREVLETEVFPYQAIGYRPAANPADIRPCILPDCTRPI